ncbi:hypothetical protein DUNSADRAFT_15599 [Dunaliella salina]|uniref:Metallo-beta-lactamase domain-containing protein n=1 Tax=Dunaliella salina TaxID=3046 RepID=A0ABQ7H1L4_DUNSA|nr:hypothetical protein DUNSADRAFT_15599 [Dunaliella salina]|eukprot:KAF5840741.1 hypothetical protein DUNSADRAFT_15599 [Dunaliella salina]
MLCSQLGKSVVVGHRRCLPACAVERKAGHRRVGKVNSTRRNAAVRTQAVSTTEPETAQVQKNSESWQACDSILPPWGKKGTSLHQVEDGLWYLRQDFFDGSAPYFNAYNTCFIVRLPGDLGNMAVSPCSMTEEAKYLLNQVPGIAEKGIQHIVANSVSPEHWTFTPGLLKMYPDATVWACPGIDTTSAAVGQAGGVDLWRSLFDDIKRSDGSAPNIRVIENNDTPFAPPELGGDVEFAVFCSDPPILQETTVLIKSKRAIVLGDMGFTQETEIQNSAPDFAKFLYSAFKLNTSLAAPIPYPAMAKNPELGAQWKAKVMSWPEWDRLLCCHLQPVVPDGRARMQECYAFLPKA